MQTTTIPTGALIERKRIDWQAPVDDFTAKLAIVSTVFAGLFALCLA